MQGSGITSAWLEDWITTTKSEEYPFSCAHHRDIEAYDNAAGSLAQMLRESKSDLARVRKLLQHVRWITPSRLEPPKTIQLRHGDFGEALAIGLIEWSTDYLVPVVKLRFQVDKDQSQHGTDIVAFILDETGTAIEGLDFCEVKVRTSRSKVKGAAVEAHAQLSEDRGASFADILDFIYQRLDEKNPAWAEALETYLSERDDPEGQNRIVVIVDRDLYTEDLLTSLPQPPDLCEPLHVDVVHCGKLRDLIASTWELVPKDLIAGSDGDGATGPR